MHQDTALRRMEVDALLRGDLPQLQGWCAWCAVPHRKSPPSLRERLREVDDRLRGAPVGQLRTDRVAQAYRGFARQLGLDPQVEQPPLDRVVVERLVAGRLKTAGRVADALTVAMYETGVSLWALDAAAVHGWPRVAVDEQDGVVLRDDHRMLARLLSDPSGDVAVGRGTAHVVVFTFSLDGVPPALIEETLRHVREGLSDPGHVR